MRDTLMTGLACLGGASLVLSLTGLLWLGGNALNDWLDQRAKKREETVRFERAVERQEAISLIILSRRYRPEASWKEGVARFYSVDELIAESVRRAGARGEMDG